MHYNIDKLYVVYEDVLNNDNNNNNNNNNNGILWCYY